MGAVDNHQPPPQPPPPQQPQTYIRPNAQIRPLYLPPLNPYMTPARDDSEPTAPPSPPPNHYQHPSYSPAPPPPPPPPPDSSDQPYPSYDAPQHGQPFMAQTPMYEAEDDTKPFKTGGVPTSKLSTPSESPHTTHEPSWKNSQRPYRKQDMQTPLPPPAVGNTQQDSHPFCYFLLGFLLAFCFNVFAMLFLCCPSGVGLYGRRRPRFVAGVVLGALANTGVLVAACYFLAKVLRDIS